MNLYIEGLLISAVLLLADGIRKQFQ